jgi:hypothetical protein
MAAHPTTAHPQRNCILYARVSFYRYFLRLLNINLVSCQEVKSKLDLALLAVSSRDCAKIRSTMANCEYRISSNDQVNVAGREMLVAVSVKPNQSICRVKAEVLDPIPVCELPDASTASCPIAQFKQGKINLEETNQQLTAIWPRRRERAIRRHGLYLPYRQSVTSIGNASTVSEDRSNNFPLAQEPVVFWCF